MPPPSPPSAVAVEEDESSVASVRLELALALGDKPENGESILGGGLAAAAVVLVDDDGSGSEESWASGANGIFGITAGVGGSGEGGELEPEVSRAPNMPAILDLRLLDFGVVAFCSCDGVVESESDDGVINLELLAEMLTKVRGEPFDIVLFTVNI